ncbi:Uma2 family endonuclease [Chloroflexi bacterium TSY]|nr:Uma2 family endonuclease [Chloroflexi bacterium TSY]
MASGLHGFIGSRMNYYLRAHVDEQGLGYVFDASATY